MNAFWIAAALFFWLAHSISNLLLLAGVLSIFALWASWRFGWKKSRLSLLVLSGLCVLMVAGMGQKAPQEGEYTVKEIHSTYAIAQSSQDRVILWTSNFENPQPDQKLYLSGFEKLDSQNNFGLFCFSDWMDQNGIGYSASSIREVSVSDSIKARIWRFTDSHPAASLYKYLFYSIREGNETDTLITKLSLPVLGLFACLKKVLEFFVERKKSSWILMAGMIVWGFCFGFSMALVRYGWFLLLRTLFKEWKSWWPAAVISFLVLFPYGWNELCFVIPAGISLVSQFQKAGWRRKVSSMAFLAIVQFSWFSSLDLISLFFFSWLRLGCGWLLTVSLPGLIWPKWAVWIGQILSWNYPSFLSIQGSLPWWMGLLLWGLLVMMQISPKKKYPVFLMAALILTPWMWKMDPFFHAWMMDIGQGDCTVIVEPFQKSVIVLDAAGNQNRDNAEKFIVPFLESRQIESVDYLILSHSDFDHDGAADSLKEQMEVRQEIRASTDLALDWSFEFLEPNTRGDDENDQSLICKFSYDEFTYLFTGDASSAVEESLIQDFDVQADVLKLGHHGSKTSSCKKFLEQVRPFLALISSGRNNSYGHPHAEVLQRLKQMGINELNTATHGMIHLETWHGFMIVHSADGLFSIVHK